MCILSACAKKSFTGNIRVLHAEGAIHCNGMPLGSGPIVDSPVLLSSGSESVVFFSINDSIIAGMGPSAVLRINRDEIRLEKGTLIVSAVAPVVVNGDSHVAHADEALLLMVKRGSSLALSCLAGELSLSSVTDAGSPTTLAAGQRFEAATEAPMVDVIDVASMEAAKSILAIFPPDQDLFVNGGVRIAVVAAELKRGMDAQFGSRDPILKIQAEGGVLFAVIASDGKQYTGTVSVAGKQMTIVTVNGSVTLPVSGIRSLKRSVRQ